jgi:hypothetical protein
MEPISSVIVAPTAERKTAPSGFAVTLRSALAGAAEGLATAAGYALPIGPAGMVLAGALRGVAQGVAAGSRTSAGGAPAASAGPSSAPGGDAFEAARLLQAEGQSFNLRYLELQERLQRESREFTAMSNVMKVRHDAARAAIQNVQ